MSETAYDGYPVPNARAFRRIPAEYTLGPDFMNALNALAWGRYRSAEQRQVAIDFVYRAEQLAEVRHIGGSSLGTEIELKPEAQEELELAS